MSRAEYVVAWILATADEKVQRQAGVTEAECYAHIESIPKHFKLGDPTRVEIESYALDLFRAIEKRGQIEQAVNTLCVSCYLMAIVIANWAVSTFGQAALPFTAFVLIP